MHFHRPCGSPSAPHLRTRAERAAKNRREKKALVDAHRSHGILVYSGREPVGWCQYGPSDELPRIETMRKYRGLAPKSSQKLWRITCFVVHKKNRRQGVATVALQAALDSIRKKGGGLVEAYPVTRWLSRAFGNESTHGTLSMFKKAGFRTVASFGATRFSSHALVRRTI
jgi:GNAT superfamily N-acetyltransferase